MDNIKIGIIGIGHLGRALFIGLLRNKSLSTDNFILADSHLEKLEDLRRKYQVKVTADNIELAKHSKVIIIAVRPRQVEMVINEIKPYLTKEKIVLSVAAGVTLELLEDYLGSRQYKLVRLMPNISVTYGLGVIGWITNQKATDKDREFITNLLQPLGSLVKCQNEEMLDKISMISSCGTGYVAYFMNNLEKIAKEYGFSEDLAQEIVLSTFAGAVHHLQFTKVKFEELVRIVATKGGITEEVIRNMEKSHFYKNFYNSIQKGYFKIKEITDELKLREGGN